LPRLASTRSTPLETSDVRRRLLHPFRDIGLSSGLHRHPAGFLTTDRIKPPVLESRRNRSTL
jgi:hypothetical protein